MHTTTCWEDKGQVKVLEAGKFGFAQCSYHNNHKHIYATTPRRQEKTELEPQQEQQ